MAKATKRKVRARGNNLKKTVRRGRKLNRAVNHVKATKKRRKSRSRRTSRKVRKSLNQSGGLAGSADHAKALFNRIFNGGILYESLNTSAFPDIRTYEMSETETGKQFILIYNISNKQAVKFRHHYSIPMCPTFNNTLKVYFYNEDNEGNVMIPDGEDIISLSRYRRPPDHTLGLSSEASIATTTVKGAILNHLGIKDENGTFKSNSTATSPDPQLLVVDDDGSTFHDSTYTSPVPLVEQIHTYSNPGVLETCPQNVYEFDDVIDDVIKYGNSINTLEPLYINASAASAAASAQPSAAA